MLLCIDLGSFFFQCDIITTSVNICDKIYSTLLAPLQRSVDKQGHKYSNYVYLISNIYDSAALILIHQIHLNASLNLSEYTVFLIDSNYKCA